jgi:hypothetical protein
MGCQEETVKTEGERPAWADPKAVTRTYDARATIEAGGHPMPQAMSDLAELHPGEVYALVTPFVPEPLIGVAAQKGFRAWSMREESEVVRTYFTK